MSIAQLGTLWKASGKKELFSCALFLNKFHSHKTFKQVTAEPLSPEQKPQGTEQAGHSRKVNVTKAREGTEEL